MYGCIFWDTTSCGPLKVNRRFGGTCRRALCLPPASPVLLPWRCWRHVPPKRLSTFNGLHGVISQKTELFITTAVRTSNPTTKVKFCVLYVLYVSTAWQRFCQFVILLPQCYVLATGIQEFVLEHSRGGVERRSALTKCIFCTVKKIWARFPTQSRYSADSNAGCVQ
jgi:hypothetical protein